MGMTFAYEQGAEFFFWLNDDCLPQAGTLAELLKFMRSHPRYYGSAQLLCRGNANRKTCNTMAFKGRKGMAAHPGEVIPVEGMSGWCVGMPAAVYTKIGAPDAQQVSPLRGR
jgi:GT2 family glycosyltransferase